MVFESESVRSETTWELTFASLRSAFRTGLSDESPNPDLNHRIASSILACFRSDTLESNDDATNLWLLRLDQIADDTQEMVDNLLTIDEMHVW